MFRNIKHFIAFLIDSYSYACAGGINIILPHPIRNIMNAKATWTHYGKKSAAVMSVFCLALWIFYWHLGSFFTDMPTLNLMQRILMILAATVLVYLSNRSGLFDLPVNIAAFIFPQVRTVEYLVTKHTGLGQYPRGPFYVGILSMFLIIIVTLGKKEMFADYITDDNRDCISV